MRRLRILVPGLVLVAACGSGSAAAGSAFTAEGEACVQFYRATQESVVDEAVYNRELADTITALGDDEAGALLSEIADEWDAGVWSGEGEETEEGLAARYARVGSLLGDRGANRCVDLAEHMGIDDYAGEPDPDEMLIRQESIWEENDLEDYKLLVASLGPGGPTQIHVDVIDGGPTEVIELMVEGVPVADLPKAIDEIYALIDSRDLRVRQYDLVYSIPRTIEIDDAVTLVVEIDEDEFPEPVAIYDSEEG